MQGNRRKFSIALYSVLALAPWRLPANGGVPTPPAEAPKTAKANPADRTRDTVVTFIDQVRRTDYGAAWNHFDPEMAKGMPRWQFTAFWIVLRLQLGPIKETGALRLEREDRHAHWVVPLAFDRQKLDLRLTVSRDGKIAGMFLAPEDLTVNWQPASYVRRDQFDELDVTVGAAGWPLAGKLTAPKAPGRHPAVVLVHGSGPNDADETVGGAKVFRDLAWGLSSRGIAVLRYIKRTRSYGSRLQKEIPQFTMQHETVDDAVAAVDFLACQARIDPGRIFVAGHSLGGYLAPRIAVAQPKTAGLIIMAGCTRPLAVLLVEQIEYLVQVDGQVTALDRGLIENAKASAKRMQDPNLKPTDTVYLLGARMSGAYFLDEQHYQPTRLARELRIPIIVLQGERDYQVRMTDFAGWQAALGLRANVTYQTYPTLNHLFTAGEGPSRPEEYRRPAHVDEAVIRDIAAWIARQQPRTSAKK